MNKHASRYLYIGAVFALLTVGAGLRSWGVLIDPLDLWADEAWWAELLETQRLNELGIRPVGFMWLSRELLALGPPELMLRLPSLAAGIGALFFIYRSAELLFRSRVAVLFVLLVAAFHPYLVGFAKEFKPFSIEILVFSALIFGALQAIRCGRTSAGFWGAAVAALPFCYPVVFMYCALALAFAGRHMARLREVRPAHAVIALLLVVPALFVANALVYEALDAAQSRYFWGNKYDVFPMELAFLDGLGWYAKKSWALLSLPGALDVVSRVPGSLFAFACIGGAVALLHEQRRRELAILAAPLFAVALANLLGYWPYGAFRTNLFLVPGLLLLIGTAIDWCMLRPRLRFVSIAAIVGVLIKVVSVDPASYRWKSMDHWAPSPQLTEVLDAIHARRRDEPGARADVIVADWHSWRPLSFYLREYPELRDHVRLVRGPLADVATLDRLIGIEVARIRNEDRPARMWVVVTRLNPNRAIASSSWIAKLSVDRREFALHDRDYHPLLFELQVPRQDATE